MQEGHKNQATDCGARCPVLHSNLETKACLSLQSCRLQADQGGPLLSHSGEDAQDGATKQSKLLASEARSNKERLLLLCLFETRSHTSTTCI